MGLSQTQVQPTMSSELEELNEVLTAVPSGVTSTTTSALTKTQQALAAQLLQLQNDNESLEQELARLQKALDAQSDEVSSIRGVRRELSTLRSSMQQVEATVGDLYIIERARVAKQVLGVKEEVLMQ